MKKIFIVVIVVVLLFMVLGIGFCFFEDKFEPTDLGSAIIGSGEVLTTIVTESN